jgi:hypothetical protein
MGSTSPSAGVGVVSDCDLVAWPWGDAGQSFGVIGLLMGASPVFPARPVLAPGAKIPSTNGNAHRSATLPAGPQIRVRYGGKPACARMLGVSRFVHAAAWAMI